MRFEDAVAARVEVPRARDADVVELRHRVVLHRSPDESALDAVEPVEVERPQREVDEVDPEVDDATAAR